MHVPCRPEGQVRVRVAGWARRTALQACGAARLHESQRSRIFRACEAACRSAKAPDHEGDSNRHPTPLLAHESARELEGSGPAFPVMLPRQAPPHHRSSPDLSHRQPPTRTATPLLLSRHTSCGRREHRSVNGQKRGARCMEHVEFAGSRMTCNLEARRPGRSHEPPAEEARQRTKTV